MLVLTGDPDTRLVATDATLTDRLRVRMHAASLDHQLAAGVCPESAIPLALRARVLVSSRMKRQLANAMERLIDEAARRSPRMQSPMPMIRRRRVLEAAPLMLEVIDTLRRPLPVAARGVAQVCVLLSDGGGPLYGADGDLEQKLRETLEALQPWTDWSW
jgi:hypothetical protein